MAYHGYLHVLFCLTVALAASAAFAENTSANYRIGPGDLLSVVVFGEEDLSLKEVRVRTSGSVSFPLLGEIKVEGLTAQELEDHLTNLLRDGFLRKPEVNVSILKYRMFYVHGAVKQPGGYSYEDGLTVQRAIALAGGFTERASKGKIDLAREEDPDKPLKSVGLNAQVNPGDIVFVGESLF